MGLEVCVGNSDTPLEFTIKIIESTYDSAKNSFWVKTNMFYSGVHLISSKQYFDENNMLDLKWLDTVQIEHILGSDLNQHYINQEPFKTNLWVAVPKDLCEKVVQNFLGLVKSKI